MLIEKKVLEVEMSSRMVWMTHLGSTGAGIIESNLRKKKTLQKMLKFSDFYNSIEKQIQPSSIKIF